MYFNISTTDASYLYNKDDDEEEEKEAFFVMPKTFFNFSKNFAQF